MNIFALMVIGLFTAASGLDFYNGMNARGFFYLLSAAINVSVLFLR